MAAAAIHNAPLEHIEYVVTSPEYIFGAVAGVAGVAVSRAGTLPSVGVKGGIDLAKLEAQNITNAQKLASDLKLQSANSPFATNGTLTQDAINNAKQIFKPGELNNPAIPPGFGKYTTDTFQSPAGNFKMHFYKNSTTGEVFYGLDYKAVFNSKSGVPKKP